MGLCLSPDRLFLQIVEINFWRKQNFEFEELKFEELEFKELEFEELEFKELEFKELEFEERIFLSNEGIMEFSCLPELETHERNHF